MKNDVLQLYRSLIRAQRRWPAQEGRRHRLGEFIKLQIRNGFRKGAGATGAEAERMILKAREELSALNSMLDGIPEKEYPLPKDSHIPAFLPSRSTFQLLDEEAQESISPQNISSAAFFPSYISAQWRNVLRRTEPVCRTNLVLAQQVRHATKKSGGSSSNGRTSQPKMLGVKRGQGSEVNPGDIIIRQRGTKWHPGPGVGLGRDHTLYSFKSGRVVFRYDIATQKRIVGVIDADHTSLPSLIKNDIDGATALVGEPPLSGSGSRTEAKNRLANALDAEHYLSLSHMDRYKYVLNMSRRLAEEDQQRQADSLSLRLMQPKRGRFSLVDLTLI
ncbi:hypothetical protein HDU67_006940 [Dinochytrium kinnereticum]|nr:hypothetical protein HDU67_006940 [Dinochytrium kinnereticum]